MHKNRIHILPFVIFALLISQTACSSSTELDTEGEQTAVESETEAEDIEPLNTPSPTNTPHTINTPVPDPIVLTGSGDSVVDLQKWSGLALAHMTHSGGGNFDVWNYGHDGARMYLLVSVVGSYDGVRPLDFMKDEDTVRFEVTASGQWQIEILPLDNIRQEIVPGAFGGSGDDVLQLVGGEPDMLTIDASSAESNFVIWGYGGAVELLVNEIAPYTGSILVPSGINILEITAVRSWSMEVTAR